MIEFSNCSNCGSKPISAFSLNKNRKNGLQAVCIACKKEYNKKHYQENRKRYLENSLKRKEITLGILYKIKETTPCKDCGKYYPHYVMDFDHVVGQKEFNLSKAHALPWDKVEKELAKCEIVCSNCHRERTHRRLSERVV